MTTKQRIVYRLLYVLLCGCVSGAAYMWFDIPGALLTAAVFVAWFMYAMERSADQSNDGQ